MSGYGVLDCACICEITASARTRTELPNEIPLSIFCSIHSSLWQRASTIRLLLMRLSHLGVASIIPTSMYVLKITVNAVPNPIFRRPLIGGIHFLEDASRFCGATPSECITTQLVIVYARR